ncbi:MICOS complex subunit MIC60, mitochondrial [Euphorbia lathyris]|uniref:MICOS complex subunit MIC60, mitochondrial n=1 Tax=Euphorbia lathyris TaxID=212925 RepID=UPI0033134D7C
MFRRSILELSSRRSVRRIPRPDIYQPIRPFLSLRKEFSTSSQQNAYTKAGPGGKPPQSTSNVPKVLLGGAVAAGAAMLAYSSGYLDQFIFKDDERSANSAKAGVDHSDVKQTMFLGEQVTDTISEEPGKVKDDLEQTMQRIETQTNIPRIEAQLEAETHTDLPRVEIEQKDELHGDLPHVQGEDRVESQTDTHHHEDGSIAVQEKKEPGFSQSTNAEHGPGAIDLESQAHRETTEGVQVATVETQVKLVTDKDETRTMPQQHLATEEGSKTALGKGTDADVASLLDTYHIKDMVVESTIVEAPQKEAFANASEEVNDGYVPKDGKLVMDFLQAIHAAEERQAELDARVFADERKALKGKYEKDLRDLRARELMRAEEAAILDKELKREKSKAAAAIGTLKEKMEEKLRTELEQKDNEAEMNLKKFQELAKAELAAAIASEKAAQIEKIAEANLHINALCMAFYARSEEARQIHSVHKLALGALALEDALSKGLPIYQELEVLSTYLEGIDKDSLVHLVLSTLPEETRYHGTDTLLQLNQKFNSLKGSLRHYVLIPPGGGGSILAHTMAQIASWLRFKEVEPSGDGIESIISRVETFLAEGKLAEAANALQEGVRGSKAEEIAGDWVSRARNRAITEQALTVLQAYAACMSLTQ